MTLELKHPAGWKDYALLDCGDFEKLERFGEVTLIRPEPQAIWPRVLPYEKWQQHAHGHFTREQKENYRFGDDIKGGWKKLKPMPDSWILRYNHQTIQIQLRLALTSFGHVGLFPEQGDNWNFVDETIRAWTIEKPRVLNLFAYTGAASVVARAAGADVTHVDASRPGLNWANQNREINGLKDIRWVYEDALKFVKREAKRGNRYHGIIMDPPPYGRGPEGEKWTLQEKLNELVALSSELLEAQHHFFILSMYAVGLSPVVGLNVVQTHFPKAAAHAGEFYLKSSAGRHLPMGTFLRFRS